MSRDCFFYTEEEKEFKEELRPWLEENIAPLVQPAINGDYDKVRQALKLMAKKDLLGAIHSKEYGGTEKGVAWESIIAEEVARINGAIEMTRLVSATLFGVPIAKFAKPEIKKKYIPKIIKGEMIGAIAMTEDTAGSDLSKMQTKIDKDGDDYIVNGHKRYITNGGKADILSIYGVLQTIEDKNPRKRITGLIVESKTPGFKVVEEYDLAGMEGASVARLEFNDMRVPAENLLGKEGQGFSILMDELNVERVGMAAACIGHAEAAFDYAMKYSQERQQFKRPIYSFEGVSFRLADDYTKIRAARLQTLEAARYIDAGDEKTATIAASMAFAFGTEMELQVTTHAVQTLAGHAITERTGLVECAFRMAPVMWVVGGTTDIQKFIIQRELVKRIKA
ncbi:MAG: acyl-CoA dehydrogenase family protein [Candidatus Helarchaeota archaeon]